MCMRNSPDKQKQTKKEEEEDRLGRVIETPYRKIKLARDV